MTLKEAIHIHHCDIDDATGEKLTHSEIYTRAINFLGGLEAVKPFIPFGREVIKEALKTDEHLNNLPMERWDLASGFRSGRQGTMIFVGRGIWYLYHKAGITAASCSDGVCILKEAARQWATQQND